MKLIELIKINNIFKPDMKFNDIQVGYNVMKFLKSIENDVKFYNDKLSILAQECAQKDDGKIKTTKDGGIVLSKDKVDKWNSEIDNLSNIEVEVKIPSFTLDDFSECNFSLMELSILEPLISEK